MVFAPEREADFLKLVMLSGRLVESCERIFFFFFGGMDQLGVSDGGRR